jgi:predicted metalloprotease with PDZ domain
VTLTVWNIVTKTTRDVKVDLNRDWGGEGVLGARMSLQTINSDTTELLHVTEVEVGSPAAEAGLKALEDYIIGTPERAVTSADSLATLAEYRKEFALVVYNRGSQTVREVTVRPSSSWGGDGVLGCQIGEGLLHQPQILRP